jgi:methyl-accepting chemotaxis protein
MKLMHLSIKARLGLVVTLSCVALTLVGMAGFNGVQQVSATLDGMADRDVPALGTLSTLRSTELGLVAATLGTTTWQNVGFAQQQYRAIVERKQALLADLGRSWSAYARLPKSADEAQDWQKLQAGWQQFSGLDAQLTAMIGQLAENDDPAATPALYEKYFKLITPWNEAKAPVETALDTLVKRSQARAAVAKADSAAVRSRAERIMTVAAGIAMAMLLLLSGYLVRSISRSLGQMRSTILTVAAESDFTLRAPILQRDETGEAAEAFNRLLAALQASLQSVLQNAGHLSELAGDAAEASRQVSAGSARQNEVAGMMAAAMQQMTVTVAQIADHAQLAASQASEAAQFAASGARTIAGSLEQLAAIEQDVSAANRTVTALRDNAARIAPVMQVIGEVADQTNLLALNAAIEAARAGEAGRGFAVVADEVRKLAERTTASAREINEMIETIDRSSQLAVTDMASVVQRVQEGRQASGDVARCIEDIAASAGRVTTAVGEISSALNEQNTAAAQVAGQVEQVTSVSEENHGVAARTASLAKSLASLAGSLQAQTGQFRV